MNRKLVVTDGTRKRELALVGRIVVGRDPSCDVTHDHSLLSRRHAEFVTAGDLVVVRDLGSRNGVFVNGSKTAEHSLKPGDIVQIGPLRAEYVLDRGPVSIAPEDHDRERTAVTAGKTPQPAPVPPVPKVAAHADDEDATRLSVGPAVFSASATAHRSAPNLMDDDDETRFTPGPGVSIHDDDDETRFTPAPRFDRAFDDEATDEDGAAAVAPVELEPPPPVEVPPPPAAATDAMPPEVAPVQRRAASPRSFVFRQLLVFGGLVLVAAAVSLRIGGVSAPASALVVPIVVILVAGYLVSGVVTRRFDRLSAERDPDRGV